MTQSLQLAPPVKPGFVADDEQPDPLVCVRRHRQEPLGVFDQRDRLIRAGLRQRAEGFASHHIGIPLNRECLLFVQAKGGLQPQDPGTRLVQPLQGHDTGLHCVRQIPDILFQVLAEQDHVHAGVDGSPGICCLRSMAQQ